MSAFTISVELDSGNWELIPKQNSGSFFQQTKNGEKNPTHRNEKYVVAFGAGSRQCLGVRYI